MSLDIKGPYNSRVSPSSAEDARTKNPGGPYPVGGQFLLLATGVDRCEHVPVRENGHWVCRLATFFYSVSVLNANLMDVSITRREGFIPSVDEYSRWIVGLSAETNTAVL